MFLLQNYNNPMMVRNSLIVKDITTIADEAKRARAEKICITAAIDFIKNRSDKKCGKCFLKTLKDAIAEVDA